MAVSRVITQEVQETAEKVLPMNPTPTPSQNQNNDTALNIQNREAAISQALTAINVFIRILAIRLFLFLSLAGSFALSIIATNTQSVQSSVVLVLYALVTTLPLTILEIRGRLGG